MQVKFNLLNNALDYILRAAEYMVGTPGTRELKYAILHFMSGITLVMKERLRKEDWKQLFKDPLEASEDLLHAGDFESIGLPGLVRRLADIPIAFDLGTVRIYLDDLRKRRNKLEHFEYEIILEKEMPLLVRLWDFVNRFIDEEVKSAVSPDSAETIAKIRELMSACEQFVLTKGKEIGAILEEARRKGLIVVPCATCYQEAVIVDGGPQRCCFCQEQSDWRTLMHYWCEIHGFDKDNYMDDIGDCPSCELPAYVKVGIHPEDPDGCVGLWYCFYCGYGGPDQEMIVCEGCRRFFAPPDLDDIEEDWTPLCPLCSGELD